VKTREERAREEDRVGGKRNVDRSSKSKTRKEKDTEREGE
jgi:hypothetical protein